MIPLICLGFGLVDWFGTNGCLFPNCRLYCIKLFKLSPPRRATTVNYNIFSTVVLLFILHVHASRTCDGVFLHYLYWYFYFSKISKYFIYHHWLISCFQYGPSWGFATLSFNYESTSLIIKTCITLIYNTYYNSRLVC